MKKIVSLLSIILLSLLGANAQKINQDKSKVEFEIGNLGLGSVDGEIKGMKGLVKFDKNNLSESKFDVTISPSTIYTENKKRDEHLKGDDFFTIEKYLTIRFISTSIIKVENGYLTKGKLTILDTTKEIEIPFNITESNGNSVLEGEFQVNRFDYGLATESYKGSFMVGETADVKITCVVE